MLIFAEKRLILYSMPKTGTTSIQKALEKSATIKFSRTGPFGLKHINAKAFQKWEKTLKAQFPGDKFVSCCVMREPIDLLKSWYRYRSRKDIKSVERSTSNITFDKYLNNLYEEKDQDKSIRSLFDGQSRFLFPKDKMLIDRIFPYEKFDSFIEFITNKIGKDFEIPRINKSPKIAEKELVIKEDTLKKIEKYISFDKAIYNQILKLGSFDLQNDEHVKKIKNIFQKYK